MHIILVIVFIIAHQVKQKGNRSSFGAINKPGQVGKTILALMKVMGAGSV